MIADSNSGENSVVTFKPIVSTSLAEAIAEQIGGMIANGVLKPGDRLPTEPELIKQFGVGRSTVREALKSLALAGLIETRRRGGTYVTEDYTGFLNDRLNWTALFSDREFHNVMEVRLALESQSAALAAQRATPEERAQLTQIVDELESLWNAEASSWNQPERAADLDVQFHLAIARASHNPILLKLVNSLGNLIHEYMRMGYVNQATLTDFSEHRRILKAILTNDSARAMQLMQAHISDTRQRRRKK